MHVLHCFRYGYGAENIIKMNAVLADGSLVTVEKDSTVYQDGRLWKTHIVGPLRFYPPYTNGLEVHAFFLLL